MQPGLSARTHRALNESATPERDASNCKHGIHPIDQPGGVPLANNTVSHKALAGDGEPGLESALPASICAGASMGTAGRLSARSTPSPPSRNRVIEYEQASALPIRGGDAPGFQVIQKQRSPSDTRSPIQELPSEVLTHVLSQLSPTDLTSVALVSKRFHDLVIDPHAWRSAFGHFFPGQTSADKRPEDNEYGNFDVHSGRRAFTRLTSLASWRSEYVMRTRLLRSLARGKPAKPLGSSSTARAGQNHPVTAIVMYNSQLFTTVNHIHASFGDGSDKRLPRFMHGADDFGTATMSDPTTGKIEQWGLTDPQSFSQFIDRFPGDLQYGLGSGEFAGAPNVMDVSQRFGMVHGEGLPGGGTFYRSIVEMRGRFLAYSSGMSELELGIPRILPSHEAVTSVWIAKSNAIPSLTDGLIGLLSGSSLGVLNAYSLGSTSHGNNRQTRFGRGELTARWVLSPGVPLTAIAIDNEHSPQRLAQNRIWAVVLNALGEVFYLTKFPKRAHADRGIKIDDETIERTAWLTGRTVYWNLVEPSRRCARPDPYADASVDGSYSPRSSWNGMCLSKDQIKSETREIEAFALQKPKEIQYLCTGWDMRRKLEVDFAGDDGHNAGEQVVVFECGLNEGAIAAVKRYARRRLVADVSLDEASTPPLTAGSSVRTNSPSIFGGTASPTLAPVPTFSLDRLDESLAADNFTGSITPRPISAEWRVSNFSLAGLKLADITATAIDYSHFATMTISEDPLLGFDEKSTASSPSLTPMSPHEAPARLGDIPGQRARLFAAGTKAGTVIIWDVRAPTAKSSEVTNVHEPLRIIHTDSPQISCLALSSLYLVHGGNDGLVQAWDPLGSSMTPVRTLNSRFSSRARRRLVQAQASPQGVGINLFAAGAICLNPNSTNLSGMVSLGTHLRYWSYSSSAADQHKSHKRRLRRGERGSNASAERFASSARSNLKDYIAHERYELNREKEQHKKDAQRLAGRFGHEMFDGSEEEMIAYAAMLSQETLEQDKLRRTSNASTAASSVDQSASATADATPAQSPSPRLTTPKTDDELDADLAEAIRQSLVPSPALSAYDVPIRQAKPRGRKGSSARPSPRPSPMLAGSSKSTSEMSDLDFTLQVSLAEELKKQRAADFPALGKGAEGKGKGRLK